VEAGGEDVRGFFFLRVVGLQRQASVGYSVSAARLGQGAAVASPRRRFPNETGCRKAMTT
jgi:hypothetical protein